jgi:hypothetical protein
MKNIEIKISHYLSIDQAVSVVYKKNELNLVSITSDFPFGELRLLNTLDNHIIQTLPIIADIEVPPEIRKFSVLEVFNWINLLKGNESTVEQDSFIEKFKKIGLLKVLHHPWEAVTDRVKLYCLLLSVQNQNELSLLLIRNLKIDYHEWKLIFKELNDIKSKSQTFVLLITKSIKFPREIPLQKIDIQIKKMNPLQLINTQTSEPLNAEGLLYEEDVA